MSETAARKQAREILQAGIDAEGAGDDELALQRYSDASEVDPSWNAPWFNRGLILKNRGRWAESFDCNQQSARLNPKDAPSWWNLGIAATALGRWEAARTAWRAYGIEVPDGAGPLEMDLGMVPIRINPRGDGEVVWCHRIDPARAIIRNVPLPESEHGYADVMLHDGAPNGERVINGKTYPVFDALALLEQSNFTTFQVTATVPDAADFKALSELADQRGLAAEDWGTVRILCRACSEGRTDPTHSHPREEALDQRRIGIAARDLGEANRLLTEWAQASPGRGYEIQPERGLDA